MCMHLASFPQHRDDDDDFSMYWSLILEVPLKVTTDQLTEV